MIEELRREAILILHKKLGAFNTYRFLAQVGQSREDHIKLPQRLFNGQSVEEIYQAAKAHRKRKKRHK